MIFFLTLLLYIIVGQILLFFTQWLTDGFKPESFEELYDDCIGAVLIHIFWPIVCVLGMVVIFCNLIKLGSVRFLKTLSVLLFRFKP